MERVTPIHWIPIEAPGGLAIMARPRGGDLLDDEVRAWRTAGIDLVVSALEPLEQSFLELDREPDLCREHGIAFERFTMQDRTTPRLDEPTRIAIERLAGLVLEGKRVAIHCRMGIGRSGLICASTLVAMGLDPSEALLRVEAARGVPVPDTREQAEWVYDFATYRLGG
jgi:protein-tyrosine phosphatase